MMAQIGMIGFGGGNALIPVIEQLAVKENGLVSQEDLEEDIIVASITPGALPVEIAGGIGKRMAGWKGMLAASVGMAIPGVVMTLLCLSLTFLVNDTGRKYIAYVTLGVSAFIWCLLTEYITGTMKRCEGKREYCKSLGLILLVFVLTGSKNILRLIGSDGTPWLKLSTIHIFIMLFFILFYTEGKANRYRWTVACIVCALYMFSESTQQLVEKSGLKQLTYGIMLALALWGFVRSKSRIEVKKINKKELAALVVLCGMMTVLAGCITDKSFSFIGNSLLSSLMSFGGGDAYLTVADGLFVQEGMMTEESFYGYLVPIVNILPGSILCKTISGIGYYIGYEATGMVWAGYVVALGGFVASIAASCGIFVVIGDIYQEISRLELHAALKRWIRIVVSGLLMTVMLSLMNQSINGIIANVEKWQGVLLFLGLYALGILGMRKRIRRSRNLLILIMVAIVACKALPCLQ